MAGGLGGAGGPETVTTGAPGAGALDRGFNSHGRGLGGENVSAGSRVLDVLALGQLFKVQRRVDAGVGELFGIRTILRPLRCGKAGERERRLGMERDVG